MTNIELYNFYAEIIFLFRSLFSVTSKNEQTKNKTKIQFGIFHCYRRSFYLRLKAVEMSLSVYVSLLLHVDVCFFFYSVSSRQHINEIESLLVYICDQCYISCVCVRVQEEKIIGARWRCCLFDYTHVHRQCRTSDVLRIQCYVVWQLSRWLTSLHQ